MRRRWLMATVGVTAMAAASMAVAGLISGTVKSVDEAKRKVTVETSNGRSQTFTIPDTADVSLDSRGGDLDDVEVGQKISVFTSSSGTVTKINVRSQSGSPAPAARTTREPTREPMPEAERAERTSPVATTSSTSAWPQFRGPDRLNRSPDSGLLQQWPSGGPPLVYKSDRVLGVGYSSVALAGDLILTMGSRGEDEFVIALNAASGDEVWSTRSGRTRRDGMGDGPRGTPTVDGDRVYALGANGDLVCLNLEDGRKIWGGNILQEFEGNNIGWGISESVLIDGDRLICTPGGQKGTMAALNKMTGRVIWTAQAPGNPPAGYASAIAIDVNGVRQYVNFTHTSVISVRADNGEFLWANNASANGTANCSSALFYDDHVFTSSGYNQGCALVKVTGGRGRSGAELVYQNKEMRNHHGGMVLDGQYLYGTDEGVMKCLDVMTGRVMWQDRSVGKGAVVYVDGKIILRSEGGPIAMMEATHEGYRELGRFDQPDRSNQAAWAHPVVADGRLYLRDQALLLVYDLRQ